jgi:uncharacterized membrane protein
MTMTMQAKYNVSLPAVIVCGHLLSIVMTLPYILHQHRTQQLANKMVVYQFMHSYYGYIIKSSPRYYKWQLINTTQTMNQNRCLSLHHCSSLMEINMEFNII